MKKFQQASVDTQGEVYATLTTVIPWYIALTDHCNKTIKKFTKSRRPSRTVMIEAANVAMGKLRGYYSVHSHHSILAVVLDPRFKFALFEQRPFDADDDDDASGETQIKYKDEAMKVLRATFHEYSTKLSSDRSKGSSNVTSSQSVSNKKDKERFHPLQSYKKTSKPSENNEILTYLQMPNHHLRKISSLGGRKI